MNPFYKFADHADDRFEERIGLDPFILKQIRDQLHNVPQDGQKSYHVPIKDDHGHTKGYAAIKRVGKDQKPVLATVLGARMKPSGQDIGHLLNASAKTASMKKAHFQGIPVTVDRPKGFVMEGTDKRGKPWKRVYLYDYGYFPGTKGGDGDGIDVFLGPDKDAQTSYWVYQKDDQGKFDEWKVFLGWSDPGQVKKVYGAHIPMKFFGHMEEIPVQVLRGMFGLNPEIKTASKKDTADLEADVQELALGGGGYGAGKGLSRALVESVHDNIRHGDHDPDLYRRVSKLSPVPVHKMDGPAFYIHPTHGKFIGMPVGDPGSLAHEIGHAQISDMPLIGRTMGASQKISRMPGKIGITGVAEAVAPGSGDYVPYMASLPELAHEGGASLKGLKVLDQAGASPAQIAKSKKELAKAFGTYAASHAGEAFLVDRVAKALRRHMPQGETT